MNNCYNFKDISLSLNNYLNDSVDCTYVIHLKNNGRYNSIIKELTNFQPTTKTYILFNDGYKKCYKKGIISSNIDLINCYLTIFKHANFNNFGNILILEDDFFFSENIKDINICNHINNYINNNKNEYVYMLGCLPTMYFGFGKHKNIVISLGTHATIYSALFVKNHNKDSIEVQDWDEYLRKYNRLMYYKPLCYQLFTGTVNSMNWTPGLSTNIIKFLIKKCNLDKNVKGYQLFYFFSSISLFILVILIMLILWILINIFKLIKIQLHRHTFF